MTEVIKQPKKRSRVNLIILIAFLVLLIVSGGYWVYGWGLKRSGSADTNQVRQSIQNNDLIDNQEINNESNQAASIPEGWKEYELAECGVKIDIPPDWGTKDALNGKKVIFLSNNYTGIIDKNYLSVNCYNSLDEFTKSDWQLVQKQYPNFPPPKDLWDALTRINPVWGKNEKKQTILYVSNVETKKFNNSEAIQAVMDGGIGESSLTVFFQKGERITSLSSTDYDVEMIFNEPQMTIINTFQWLE